MSRNYPDLDSALGRAWLDAAGIEKNVQQPNVEGDPILKSEIARLAHAVKVLCEVVEQLQETRHAT